MKKFLILLFLFGSTYSFSQYVLKGSISDPEGDPIPGARIFVENTSYGVITDYNGNYFIELSAKKQYTIVYQMIGMMDTIIKIDINSKIKVLNITMIPNAIELNTVNVSDSKIDVAKKVIKAVQNNRKNLLHQFENYACQTYQKTGLEKSPKVKPDTLVSDTTNYDPVKMNLIESYAESRYISPGIYHEKVLAYHDYSEKSENIPTSSEDVSLFFNDKIVPLQTVMVNPYIFFERIEDGDFNLYQNMINLPKISENPITSPVGIQAFTNYNFELNSIFYENNQKIYEIGVSPKFKFAPLVSGRLYIIDEIWVIKSFELSVNSAAMPFFNDFTIIQDYELFGKFWAPTRREYIYTILEESDNISANTRVNHSNYKFNQDFTEKDFKNELLHYADDAFDHDSIFWINTRPIQLKTAELDYIEIQQRIEDYETSEHYLDSVDAEYNKITFWDVTLNGIGIRKRYSGEEIRINSLLEGLKILGVGGFRYGVGGSYSKTFDNSQTFRISPTIDYGFKNKDLKGQLGLEYIYKPLTFASISLKGGDIYDMVTTQKQVLDLFGRNNYVRNTFVEVAHRQELVNGLYGRIKFAYSDRRSIESLKLASWVDRFTEYINSDTSYAPYFSNFNKPVAFDRYKISSIELKFHYRFKQKYIIKGNRKLIVGTTYPELELTYRKGIPELFGSEVNFDMIELRLSDEVNFGNYGDSKWSMTGGSYLNQKSLRFIENKFFRGSDFSLLSNPLYTHQTLDSTFYTSNPYLQGFYVHHFNGFIMNKIPLINRLKLELAGGASILAIQDQNYLHGEFFFGVERKFRLFKQYFKYGIYYAGRTNNSNAALFRLKIGFDYFNTFTNSWTY